MALPSTLYRFHIELSDVDRGVYEALDLRVAQHPSEVDDFTVARVLAYCLSFEEGLAFGPGLGEPDEPALAVTDLQGTRTAWVEDGTPSAERLHRASKACKRVSVFTHHDPDLLRREAAKREIHRAQDIAAFALDRALVRALAGTFDRQIAWEITHLGGILYVKHGDTTLEGSVTPLALA